MMPVTSSRWRIGCILALPRSAAVSKTSCSSGIVQKPQNKPVRSAIQRCCDWLPAQSLRYLPTLRAVSGCTLEDSRTFERIDKPVPRVQSGQALGAERSHDTTQRRNLHIGWTLDADSVRDGDSADRTNHDSDLGDLRAKRNAQELLPSDNTLVPDSLRSRGDDHNDRRLAGTPGCNQAVAKRRTLTKSYFVFVASSFSIILRSFFSAMF